MMNFLGIANAGINTIVSLLEPNEADEVGLVNEKILSENNGMKFISLSFLRLKPPPLGGQIYL